MITRPQSFTHVSRAAQYSASLLLVFAAYFYSAKIGLSLDAVSGFATLIWAPTGIALASLLLGGRRLWPAVTLGALVINLHTGAPFPVALGIAMGNTGEALLGAYLLILLGFHRNIDRLRDIFLLVVFGAALSAAVSATVGVFCLWLGGVRDFEGIIPTWRAWWIGDALGAFVVAPFLLVWGTSWRQLRFSPLRALEAALLVLSLSTAAFLELKVGALAFWLFPFVVWGALRFGQIGAVTTVFLISGMSVWGAAHGSGPFMGGALRDNLLLLHGFIFIIGTTATTLAASLSERVNARAEQELARQRLQLQYQVMSAIADAESLDDGYMKILQVITEALDWEFGAFWMVDHEENILRCKKVWAAPRANITEFLDATYRWTFTPGKGLPGRVWESKKPAWIVNVAVDDNFPRAPIAQRNSLHGAFGFPILSKGKVVGVMEFFCREIRDPEEDLLSAIAISGGQIGQFLDRMAAEENLRHAVQSRDEFLSIASHELKTPLTSLSLQLQMTRRKINPATGEAPSPERLAHVFAVAEQQTDRLKGLVDDLLDASRIQTGKFSFNFERADLSLLVQDMVERFSADLQRAGCRIALEIQPQVEGVFDHARIEQVMDNFLSNALKYAPRTLISVSLRELEGVATLRVRDEGPGIPADKHAKVFERFERATDARGVTGLGLGLFIVREIAAGHGGEVLLKSGEGEGSEFSFRFPLKK